MASYIINESIAGAPLFVPDANDYFTVEAGTMPNGDDCLVIDGVSSTNYKAFCPAPTVSPNMFQSRDYTTVLSNMSIVFWIKCSPGYTYSGSSISQCHMFGVYNDTSNPSSTSDTGWQQGGMLWGVSAAGTSGVDNKITLLKVSASSGGGASASFTSATLPTDTWTMITMNPSASTDGGFYVNDDVSNTGGTWASGEGTFSSDTISNPYFCIGNFKTDAYSKARNDVWRLGKLSFHDHHLNATERAALYTAMVG